MKITFVSNYINHHQIPVSNVMYEFLSENYTFVQTEPMEEERLQMGWNSDVEKIPYLKKFYEEEEDCRRLISESDVVIFGGTEREELIEKRLEEGKPVIRYSERLYKEGQWKWISPRGLKKKYHDHTRFSEFPVYLLCSGAYVSDDFHLIRAYEGKRFAWGYFPEFLPFTKEEIDARMQMRKSREVTEILWAGRMIDWKHPESCIPVARYLKEQGKPFHITIIGDGDQRPVVEDAVLREGLSEYFTFTGSKKPEEVREAMNDADIFLFTSDYKEGWGAVLNEAMNAGCAVVASHAIGAVPTLLTHNMNGLIYKSGDTDELAVLTKELVENPEMRIRLGENAYHTLESEWNHRVAGERLYHLCEQILNGDPKFFQSGPLSEAKVIHQRDMYRTLTKNNRHAAGETE